MSTCQVYTLAILSQIILVDVVVELLAVVGFMTVSLQLKSPS